MKSRNRNFQNRDDNRRPFNRSSRPGGWNGGGGSGNYRQSGPMRPPSPDRFSEAETHFLSLAAIDPHPRIVLENGLIEPTVRAMDLLTPIGRGQRGLIVSPPKSGKTTFLKQICQALIKSDPTLKVYCLLVDERPEEVTDFKRSVSAEIHFSTSDQPYENHIRVAKQLMGKAIAEADQGKDVMILVDSLTRLARVHNSATRGSGRTLSGGVDANGLLVPRRIFGCARKIENGGSLGILATILVQTGSRMDDVIFQEFKGTGNMELVLSREAAERRIFPAINIRESGTRKEENLIPPDDLKKIYLLRQALASMPDVEASQALVSLLNKHKTNRQLLDALS